MKKYIYIALSILVMLPVKAKIEILDRVAIIVGEGVVLESQVKSMLENIESDPETGSPPIVKFVNAVSVESPAGSVPDRLLSYRLILLTLPSEQ